MPVILRRLIFLALSVGCGRLLYVCIRDSILWPGDNPVGLPQISGIFTRLVLTVCFAVAVFSL